MNKMPSSPRKAGSDHQLSFSLSSTASPSRRHFRKVSSKEKLQHPSHKAFSSIQFPSMSKDHLPSAAAKDHSSPLCAAGGEIKISGFCVGSNPKRWFFALLTIFCASHWMYQSMVLMVKVTEENRNVPNGFHHGAIPGMEHFASSGLGAFKRIQDMVDYTNTTTNGSEKMDTQSVTSSSSSSSANIASSGSGGNHHRVAIVVAGTWQRYLLQSTVDHLIRPLQNQGHTVDYYLALMSDAEYSFRPDGPYLDKLEIDPIFRPAVASGTTTATSRRTLSDPKPDENPGGFDRLGDKNIVTQIVQQQIEGAGARLQRCTVKTRFDITSNRLVMEHRLDAKLAHPEEDLEMRFPIFNMRYEETAPMINRDMLRRWLAVQELWTAAQQVEEDEHFRYDYVLFLREDTLWLDDFDLNRLVQTDPVADVWVPSCNAIQEPAPLIPPADREDDSSPEVYDRVMLTRRKSPGTNVVGEVFSQLFDLNQTICELQLPKEMRAQQGCNMRMLLKQILEKQAVKVHSVGQAYLPMEPAVHYSTNNPSGEVQTCYHSFCQSRDNPLEIANNASYIPKCQEVVPNQPSSSGMNGSLFDEDEADLSSTRTCLSPEYVTKFPYAGCPAPKTPSPFVVGQSRTSSTTCGMCHQNRFTSYLYKMSEQIRSLKEAECKGLMLYTVSFGTYRKGAMRIAREPTRSRKGSCTILFVLEQNNSGDKSELPPVIDPGELVVPIKRELLPFKSHRRNVKLFKMHGINIFWWVDRLIWIDAKLNRAVPPGGLRRYFRDTIGTNNVCAAFIAAPVHKNIIGDYAHENMTKPIFWPHCETVINALELRPTVTDSVDAIRNQCEFYRNQTIHDEERKAAEIEAGNFVSLDDGMIDSALIAWDLRTPWCRQFNADLGCTWSDEIQCNADRDQISFPYAMRKMGLRERSRKKVQDTVNKNTYWLEKQSGRPAVEIVKSKCHWYNYETTRTLDCANR